MTHAYKEYFLDDAMETLGSAVEYAVLSLNIEGQEFLDLFLASGIAERFGHGDAMYVSSMSGIELARAVVEATYKKKKLPEPGYAEGLSPEYWAGWTLAEYQWYSGKRFRDIFEHVKLSEIIPMYSVYHEMDVSKFIETMDERCSTELPECRLKKLRESRGLSQSELAKISGVSLRSIQMYEQRVNDIDKAQAQTIYKLSRVIGCAMEDLLEKPME